jgi:drug/metabolite transporter (DMT)-like permease
MTRSDWSLILVLSVLWGGAFFFVEIGLRGFPPNTLVFLRMALAAVPLLLLCLLRNETLPKDMATWGAFTVLGLLNVVIPFILFTWGQTKISSGLASILNATTPLWGVVAAHFLTRDEKATPLRIIGVLLGIAGVATMVGGAALGQLDANIIAQLACIIGTLGYALASIYGRRFGAGATSPLVIATGQCVTSAMIMLPIMMLTDQPWTLPVPGFAPVFATVALAFVSTSLPYVLYFRLLASAGATNSLLITFLTPVTAIVLGFMLLDETLALRQVAGMVLIAAGLIAMDGRLLRRQI